MREYAIFLAFDHELADRRREQIRRDFHSTGPGLTDRVVSVLHSLRSAISGPADQTPGFTTSLSDASRS